MKRAMLLGIVAVLGLAASAKGPIGHLVDMDNQRKANEAALKRGDPITLEMARILLLNELQARISLGFKPGDDSCPPIYRDPKKAPEFVRLTGLYTRNPMSARKKWNVDPADPENGSAALLIESFKTLQGKGGQARREMAGIIDDYLPLIERHQKTVAYLARTQSSDGSSFYKDLKAVDELIGKVDGVVRQIKRKGDVTMPDGSSRKAKYLTVPRAWEATGLSRYVDHAMRLRGGSSGTFGALCYDFRKRHTIVSLDWLNKNLDSAEKLIKRIDAFESKHGAYITQAVTLVDGLEDGKLILDLMSTDALVRSNMKTVLVGLVGTTKRIKDSGVSRGILMGENLGHLGKAAPGARGRNSCGMNPQALVVKSAEDAMKRIQEAYERTFRQKLSYQEPRF